MYLPPADVDGVLERLVTRCAGGVVAFDALSPWVLPVSNAAFGLTTVDTRFTWGYDRPVAPRVPDVRRRAVPAERDAAAPLHVLIDLRGVPTRRRSSSVSSSR